MGALFLMEEVPLYGSSERVGFSQDRKEFTSCAPVWTCYVYRGTSLQRDNPTVGPYSRTMPRALWSP